MYEKWITFVCTDKRCLNHLLSTITCSYLTAGVRSLHPLIRRHARCVISGVLSHVGVKISSIQNVAAKFKSEMLPTRYKCKLATAII